MTEFGEAPLDEPSTALKQAFRSLIDEAVIDGVDELSFPLQDGRVLSIAKDVDGLADDRVYHAQFCERIVRAEDKIFRYSTFYHVYASGEVVKSVDTEEEKDIEALEASRQVRVADLIDLDDQTALEHFLLDSLDPPYPADNDEEDFLDDKILKALRISQEGDDLGLMTVSGTELQSVLEIITEKVNAARVDAPKNEPPAAYL